MECTPVLTYWNTWSSVVGGVWNRSGSIRRWSLAGGNHVTRGGALRIQSLAPLLVRSPYFPKPISCPCGHAFPTGGTASPLELEAEMYPFFTKLLWVMEFYKPGLEFELFSSFSLTSPIPRVLVMEVSHSPQSVTQFQEEQQAPCDAWVC